LLTIFQQISAHAEEGIQILIAAGFTLGATDEVPYYLSREPDIERDMDGLLKATFKVLEKECG
jgi:hypothetical protein